MNHPVNRKRSTVVRHLIVSVAAGSLLASVAGIPAQETTTATPPPAVQPVDPRRTVEETIQAMREGIINNDLPAAKAAIERMEQIDPSHPSLSVYRSMLERKMSAGQSGPTTSRVVTPVPTPRPTPSPTPVATPRPAAPPSRSAARGPNWMLIGGAAAGLVVVLGLLVAVLRRRKTAPVPAPAAEPQPRQARPEPPPVDLLFDGEAEETPAAPEEGPTTTQPAVGRSVAEQFASSVGPGTASNLLSPGFDIPDTLSVTSKPKTPSSIQDLPTVFEAPDLPPATGDAPAPAGDSRPLPATVSAPPPPPPPMDEVVTFESIGLPTADDLPPPAPAAPPSISAIAIPDASDQLSHARDETIAVPPGARPPQPVIDPMGASITLDDIMSTQQQVGGVPEQKPATPADGSARGIASLSLDDDLAETKTGLSTPPPVLADETLHGMDTIALNPPGSQVPPASMDETLPLTGSPVAPAPPSPADSVYVSSPAPGTGGSADERSEKMFREQYEKGLKAVGDRDWRQAVHYLSIAAAIHPDDEEVRTHLRNAREEKKRAENKA